MSAVTAESQELNPVKLTLLHRWKAANLLVGKSCEASGNIMSQFEESKKILNFVNTKVSTQFCQKCGNVFMPGNHIVTFVSKLPFDERVKKSLKRTKRKRGLIKAKEKRNVDKYYDSTPHTKLFCKICFNSNVLTGASRKELQTLDVRKNKSDDSVSGFTPTLFGNSNKTSTPVRTSTLNTSINKSSKRKRNATSRLSSLLKNQSSSSSPNGSLQDFLSSL